VLLTTSTGLTAIDVEVGSAQPGEAFDLWLNGTSYHSGKRKEQRAVTWQAAGR
jgi:hypothetical protein